VLLQRPLLLGVSLLLLLLLLLSSQLALGQVP
jgi:hypothetical protein